MATVPVYQPQVREQALQGGFQRAPDTGRDLMRAGEALARVGDFVDRADLRDAQAKADEIDATITSEWLKWDAENRPKYRGQNVDAYGPAAQEWWKKAGETYGKDLDPRTKALASNSLIRKQGSALANVTQFVGAEKERHADEAASASINSTIQFGVTTGDVAGAAEQVRQQVAQVGARKGWTTEQVQTEQLKNLSALHLAQITKLAEMDPAAAQSYYQANKAEVGAAQQPRVEEILRKEADNAFATQFAAEQATKPLSEQLRAASEVKDPERREKVLLQIKNNHAMVKAAEEEREAAASNQAWQMFAQGRKIPEAVLSQMNGRERAQLQESQLARADRLASGGSIKTNWADYIEVREKLAAGEKVDLRGYVEKIAPAQMEQLLDIQTKRSNPGETPEAMSQEAQLSAHTRTLDLKGENLGRFQSAFGTEVSAFIKRVGKEPNYDERQKILDGLTREVVTDKGWLWDTKEPAYRVAPDKRGDVTADASPTTAPTSTPRKIGTVYAIQGQDRALIVQALRAEGVPISEDAIQARYRLAKKLQ